MEVSKTNQIKYRLLWLFEHFFRHSYFGKNRQNLSNKIGKSIKIDENERLIPVPVMESYNEEVFQNNYIKKSIPVVLKGFAKNWGAIEKWTPEYLADQYPRFPIALFDKKEENPELGGKVKYTSLKEYVEDLKRGTKNYIRFLPLFDKQPELQKDFSMDFINSIMKRGSRTRTTQLFMGAGGTQTSLHGALGSNLFVQVYGRKRWWIFDNSYSPLIEPVVEQSVFFRSNLSGEFPSGNMLKVPGWSVELEPGDVLYNPPFFWHQVRSLTENIGIGFRWYHLPSMLRSSITQTILTLTASNPSIPKVKKMDGYYAEMHARLLKEEEMKNQ